MRFDSVGPDSPLVNQRIILTDDVPHVGDR